MYYICTHESDINTLKPFDNKHHFITDIIYGPVSVCYW